MSEDAPLKRCSKCKEEFSATTKFFDRRKLNKDGLNTQCKKCTKAYRDRPEVKEKRRSRQKAYKSRPEIREKTRIYDRAFYHEYRRTPEEREKRRAEGVAYRKRPEVREKRRMSGKSYRSRPEVKEHNRDYRKEYLARPEARESHRTTWRAYATRHQDRIRGMRKKYWSRPEVKSKHSVYQINRDARKKSIPGSHTAQQSREQYERQKGKCYWCGQKLTWGKHHEDHIVPLTREGSSNDISNIVIAHPHCNISRHNKLPHEAYKFGFLL